MKCHCYSCLDVFAIVAVLMMGAFSRFTVKKEESEKKAVRFLFWEGTAFSFKNRQRRYFFPEDFCLKKFC